MVFLLVRKEHITAREMAEYFGVSKRTILRDIDTLSIAGIPIYTTKGKGGGVQILKEFTLDKTILTKEERERIVNGLQVMQATNIPNTDQLLTKISALFKNENIPSWIDVDFSYFGSSENEKNKFTSIQVSILNKRVIQFDYFTSELQHSRRTVEPLRLLFRYQAWYVFGYCRYRQDYRFFRTSRMKEIFVTEELFDRELNKDMVMEPDYGQSDNLKLCKLRFSSEIAHRVYDEYDEDHVQIAEDKSFIVTEYYPINEWFIQHLLSFGAYVEVLEPAEVRDLMKERAKAIVLLYK